MINFNYKRELKDLGINDTMLAEIANIVKTNKDQHSMINESRPIGDVSLSFYSKSKTIGRIYKVFKDLSIYNIIYIDIKPGKYNFRCKTSSGNILSFEIDKDKKINFKMATGLALVDFVKQIVFNPNKVSTTSDLESNAMENNTETNQTEELEYPGLGKLKINIPNNASPEARESLNDFLQQLQSGKINLNIAARSISDNATIINQPHLNKSMHRPASVIEGEFKTINLACKEYEVNVAEEYDSRIIDDLYDEEKYNITPIITIPGEEQSNQIISLDCSYNYTELKDNDSCKNTTQE